MEECAHSLRGSYVRAVATPVFGYLNRAEALRTDARLVTGADMYHQITRCSRTALAALMLGLISHAVSAADPDIYATRDGAIRGADPVAYFSLEPGDDAVMGTDEFTYEWSGATWKFASAGNRDLFAADPEKYAPQYGGYCAFAVSHNFTKTIKPDVWEIVEEKLYLNYNRRAYNKWAKDKSASIVRGDANWPNVLLSCEDHKNCRKP